MYLVLVGCAKAKLDVPAPASDIYVSPLFRASMAWAQATQQPVRILSAKYGILPTDTVIEPYDVYLGDLTARERSALAYRVREQLRGTPATDVVVLGGKAYVDLVREALPDAAIHSPLEMLNIGNRIRWLNTSVGSTWCDFLALEDLYALLREFAGGALTAATLPSLEETLAGRIPERGVYFFFELGEYRRGRQELRVTRVGTHAVSQNAKSTLRGRLRTHAGTAALAGSHRSSIFRLHVGAALQHQGDQSIQTWGKGSGGVADAETRVAEAPLEVEVSRYMRRTRVLLVEIADTPSARSDRSFVERNSIGTLSTAGRAIDPPSEGWLGNCSPRPEIRQSGVWNLDHLYSQVNPAFISTLSSWMKDRRGDESRAPQSWWDLSARLFE